MSEEEPKTLEWMDEFGLGQTTTARADGFLYHCYQVPAGWRCKIEGVDLCSGQFTAMGNSLKAVKECARCHNLIVQSAASHATKALREDYDEKVAQFNLDLKNAAHNADVKAAKLAALNSELEGARSMVEEYKRQLQNGDAELASAKEEVENLKFELAGERQHVQGYVDKMDHEVWEEHYKKDENPIGWRCLVYNCISIQKAQFTSARELSGRLAEALELIKKGADEEEEIHLALRQTRDKQEALFESVKLTHPENYRLFREAREKHHERLLEIRRNRSTILTAYEAAKKGEL